MKTKHRTEDERIALIRDGGKTKHEKKKRAKEKPITGLQAAGSRNPDVNKAINIYNELSGEREKHLDPLDMLNYLQRKSRKAVNITEKFFEFGFSVDRQFFYIRSGYIASKNWTDDLDSIIDKAKKLPRIYITVNNLLAHVMSCFEDTKTDYECWQGKQWTKTNDPTNVLYGGTVKAIAGYIAKQPDAIEYRRDLTELKYNAMRLKGVLKAIEMQHMTVNGALYHSRKSGDIFAAGSGGMLNSMDDSPDIGIEDSSVITLDMDDMEQNEDTQPRKRKGKKHAE